MSTEQEYPSEDLLTASADGDYAVTSSKNDIEQVRDLLFGEYNREYDRQIRTLYRHIESMDTNVHRLIEQTERIEREKSTLEERLREHQLRTQVQMDEMQRVMQDRLRQQQREFDIKMDGLLTTIHQMVDDLDGKKLDQQQMADMVIELGMRIKRNINKPAYYGPRRLTDEEEEA